MYLIIDTSSKKSLALSVSRKTVKKNIWNADFRHSEKLLPKISGLVGSSDLKRIKGIGVVSGPGSYTGLRVGVAVANALGYAQKVPLIEINKFEWLAKAAVVEAAKIKGINQVCAIVPAIHDQFFAGIIRLDGESNTAKGNGRFFTGTISQLCKEIFGPTFFSIEDIPETADVADEEIIKGKIGRNFAGMKRICLYGKSGISTLSDLVNEKYCRKEFKDMVRPLYIHKPNITRAKR